MNVELPDGTVIHDVPDDITKEQLSAKLKANNLPVPGEKKTPRQMAATGLPRSVGRAETLVGLGSQALGTIAGGIAGIGATIRGGPEKGAQAVRDVQQAMSYEPKTQLGQQGLERLTAIPELATQGALAAGGGVTEMTGSPALGAGTATALSMLPAIASRAGRPFASRAMAGAEASAAGAASRAAVKDSTLRAARAEGYVVPQTAVEPTLLGHAEEIIGGKKATADKASLRNQEITDKIARREAGMGPDEPLNLKNLREARTRAAQPYREVSALSPTANAAWEESRRARAESEPYWHHAARTGDPASLKEAKRLDAESKFWEGVIDQEATKLGDPDLLQRLKNARMTIAKNHEVKNALNYGSGEVDATYMGRLFDKNPEKFTDGLEVIGRFAQAFPKYIKPGIEDSMAPVHVGAHGGGGGLSLFGWLGSGVPGLRSPVQSMALSKMRQVPKEYKPGMGVSLFDIGTRPAATGAAALAPALGLRPPRESSE